LHGGADKNCIKFINKMNLFIKLIFIRMVGVIEEIDSYLQYLVEKYFVFHELAELDEANTIDDIVILKRDIANDIEKLTDDNMIGLTKTVFSKFRFYNIDIKDKIGGFGSRLNLDVTEMIYLHYKKYKSSFGYKIKFDNFIYRGFERYTIKRFIKIFKKMNFYNYL